MGTQTSSLTAFLKEHALFSKTFGGEKKILYTILTCATPSVSGVQNQISSLRSLLDHSTHVVCFPGCLQGFKTFIAII